MHKQYDVSKNNQIIPLAFFKEYISHLITPSLKILGYTSNPEDSPQNVTLRNQLIYWACKIEDNECINWALRHFNNWTNQKDPDKINP